MVHDFWKKYHEVHISSRCTCGINLNKTHRKLGTRISNSFSLETTMWTSNFCWSKHLYTYKRGRNFKTILKENYAIALDRCYLFAKKMLNMELSMMLTVLMECAYINHSRTLQQFQWIPCNLNKWRIWRTIFFYIIIRFHKANFFYKPWWLRHTGNRSNKVRYWLQMR